MSNREFVTVNGFLFGLALAILVSIFLLAKCTDRPSLDVRQGETIDPCVACWDACGKTDAQIPTIYCSQECNTICAVLHQDGGS